jgi:O-acetylserine/cysteine efflux transporter
VVPWVPLVVAMASAWALLDQWPTSEELVGGLVLIVGVLVALRPSRHPIAVPATELVDA